MELLRDGRLATSDDPAIIFGCLNEDFIQNVCTANFESLRCEGLCTLQYNKVMKLNLLFLLRKIVSTDPGVNILEMGLLKQQSTEA